MPRLPHVSSLGQSSIFSTMFCGRDFTILWLAQFISNLGSQFSWIAMIWLMFNLTESTLMMGLLSISEVLPMLVLGPLAGVIVDRIDRKYAMSLADFFQGMVMLTIPFSAILPPQVRPWFLITAAFSNASAQRFFYPARSSAIPKLVPSDKLSTANSITATIFQLTSLLGPASAGVLIALAGYDLAFIIDGVSFLISAMAILLIRTDLRPGRSETASVGVRKDISEGFRVFAASRVLQFILVIFSLLMLTAGAVFVLIVPYLKSVGLQTHGEAEAISGFIFSFSALTGVITGVILGSRASLKRPLSIMIFAIFLAGFTMIGLSFSPNWLIAMIMMGGFGAIEVAIGIPMQTTVQELVPDYLRGKVFSVLNLSITVAQILGMAFAGIAATLIPIGAVFLLAGLVTLVISTAGLFVLVKGRLNSRIALERLEYVSREPSS